MIVNEIDLLPKRLYVHPAKRTLEFLNNSTCIRRCHIKQKHSFVARSSVGALSSILVQHFDVFTHVLQGCLTGEMKVSTSIKPLSQQPNTNCVHTCWEYSMAKENPIAKYPLATKPLAFVHSTGGERCIAQNRLAELNQGKWCSMGFSYHITNCPSSHNEAWIEIAILLVEI